MAKQPWDMSEEEIRALDLDEFNSFDKMIAKTYADLYWKERSGEITVTEECILREIRDYISPLLHDIRKQHDHEIEKRQKKASEIINSGEAWKVTQAHFLEHHRTGRIPESAYDSYQTKEGISWLGDKAEFPNLVAGKEYDDEFIELRQRDEKLQYVKTDDDGEIVRDDQGLSVLLNEDEMKERGLPLTDTSIVAFNENGEPVGMYSNEFGTDGVWVVEEYQRRGIGLDLLLHGREQFGPTRKMGQATGAGEILIRSYHKCMVEKALSEGEAVPRETLQAYPDLQEQQETKGMQFENENNGSISLDDEPDDGPRM